MPNEKGKVLRSGQILKHFKAEDSRAVVLRAPQWKDLDDLLDFINSLVEEEADICRDKKATREEEADWLGRLLVEIEKGVMIGVVAEVEGRVVANSEVKRRSGPMGHVGYLGIAIKAGYRNMGIGTEMMKTLIEESRKMGLKVLVLEVFASNKRARHVYEKVGFKESGRIPKGIYKKGKYIDSITMTMTM